MIANVSTSRNIAATLQYNENEKKGGELILSNGIDPTMSVEEQARYLEALHNRRFKVKAHTIVISHGDKDSKMLTPELERKYLISFLNELEERGVDLNSAPWVIARHGNTDNIHYHMAVMNTCNDGSRFNDSHLGRKATLAAAAVSIRWGLEYAPRAADNVSIIDWCNDKLGGKKVTSEKTRKRTKKWYNRKEAIEQAKRRRYEGNNQEAYRQQAQEKQESNKDVQNSNLSDSRTEGRATYKGRGR